MNLYFTVFTLHSLCQYIVVFLGYFWLSRLKPKNQKTIKNRKKPKNQISNLKNHWFFHPCANRYRFFRYRNLVRSRTVFYSVQETVTKNDEYTDWSDDRQLCCLFI